MISQHLLAKLDVIELVKFAGPDHTRSGHPTLDLPPVEKTLARWDSAIALPALSLTVITGVGPPGDSLQ